MQHQELVAILSASDEDGLAREVEIWQNYTTDEDADDRDRVMGTMEYFLTSGEALRPLNGDAQSGVAPTRFEVTDNGQIVELA